jgi:hypothetical protein
LKEEMRRNFDATVQPVKGCPGPATWTNEQIFERWGDDNTVYFLNVPDQIMLMTGPAPLDMSDVGDGNGNRSFKESVFYVNPGEQMTSFLCEETKTTTRTFSLPPQASAKVFVDAWEHYQTVPLLVTASGEKGAQVHYEWQFYNYIPIQTGSCRSTHGNGTTESGGVSCPPSMNQSVQHGLTAPIIRTLGHTNRSPMGEFPVSKKTKEQHCIKESERPFLIFKNVEQYPGPSLTMTIKVAQ